MKTSVPWGVFQEGAILYTPDQKVMLLARVFSTSGLCPCCHKRQAQILCFCWCVREGSLDGPHAHQIWFLCVECHESWSLLLEPDEVPGEETGFPGAAVVYNN